MTYRLTFTIPELPLPVNRQTSMHWAQKGKYVKHWHTLVGAAVAGKKPPKPLDRARLTFIRYSSTEPDFDGLVSSFKCVCDGLIKAGVIVDDKPSNIGRSVYDWQKAPPKHGKIFVGVEELPPAPKCEPQRKETQ